MPIDESQAYLTHPDGTKIQILRTVPIEDPSTGEMLERVEWDEAATAQAYSDYAATAPASAPAGSFISRLLSW